MNLETSLEEIVRAIRREMPFLVERYKVKSIGVFGSCVRGDQRRGSDLDLLVTFWEAPGLLQFIELENYLSDRLGVKIDLVMEDALKPRIRDAVLSEVLPL